MATVLGAGGWSSVVVWLVVAGDAALRARVRGHCALVVLEGVCECF